MPSDTISHHANTWLRQCRRRARMALPLLLALILAAYQALHAHDVVNLVAAYGFTEGTGTTVADLSGNSNVATLLNGTTWAAGKFGSAVSFDGANDFVSIPDRASLRLGSTGTVEAWVMLDRRNRWNGVLGKATSSADAAHNYAIEINSANRPNCILGNGTTTNVATGTTALQAKRFYHLACAWDGSQLRLYVDGVLNKTVAQTITPVPGTGPLVIGQYGGGVDYLDGIVDEVRIFNVAVSQANIQLDMNTAIELVPDTTPPTVTVTAPAEGETVSGVVALVANATDDRVVAGVRFFVDGVQVGSEVTTSPYSVTWDTRTAINGAHAVTAVARDATGNTATSPVRSVTASNPPRLVITQPTNGSSFTSSTVGVTYAIAGDTTGFSVDHVHFQLDGGAERMDPPPIDGVYTLTSVTPGTHTLTGFLARADHTKIAGTDSAPVTFAVLAPDSTPPQVAITSPASGAVVNGVVTLAASATDNIGVVGVQFQVDGANVGTEDTTDPYSVQWNAVGQGQHVITAVARDASNNVATSNPVTVTVSDPNDPAVIGQWSAAMNWPLVAVHMSHMPTGEILMWDGWELPSAAAKVWNPTTNVFYSTPVSAGVFCAAQALLPDGKVLVIGGHAGGEIGIPDVFTFDPFTRSWARAAYMNFSRWYPSANRLGDGRVVTISGQLVPGTWADTPEIYSPSLNQWSVLDGARTGNMHDSEYPLSFLLPDGTLYVISALLGQAHTMNVSPQAWSSPITMPVPNGSAAMYRPGKILMSGGGVSGVDNPSQPTTGLVDATVDVSAWRPTAPMAYGRYEHNLVVLADGDVLAVGGSTTVTTSATVGTLPAELWNAATESWSTMAAMRDPRMYHSTALLLPDGRVLVAGGGRLGAIPSYQTAEIFSPPYLFRGARPTISGAPTAEVLGGTITIDTPDAANIARVALVPLGTVTHTLNMNQTFVELPFTIVSGGLQAELPSNPNVAPPGHYMLFILNGAGVPAVAPILRILDPATGADTVPPIVTITNPVSAQIVSGAVPVMADAFDDFGVTSVQFQVNGQNLGASDTMAPFAVSWDTTSLVDGDYVLTAVARDAAGNVTTSGSVTVTVWNGAGPGVYLGHTTVGLMADSGDSNHMNASRFVMPENGTALSLSVYISSPVGASPNNLYQVAIYSDQNGAPANLLLSTPSHTIVPDAWNTVPISGTLQANTAYWLAYNTNGTSDAVNNLRADIGSTGQWGYHAQAFGAWPTSFGSAVMTNYQASIFVTYQPSTTPVDTTPPTATVTAPAAGSTLSGTVTVTASAADDVAVASVQFRVDGQDLGTLDTTAPYSVTWDTTLLPNGSHTLTAVATDTSGNVTTSAGVAVTVSNATSTAHLLGYATIGSSVDSDDANHINTWRFVMPNESGTATSLSVYIAGPISSAPNNQFQVAIYADKNGAPGALIASTPSQAAIANGWNTVPVKVALQPNTAYWLAYNTNADSASANDIRYDAGSPGQGRYRAQTFGTWPNQFGTGGGSSASRGSIYLTYTVP